MYPSTQIPAVARRVALAAALLLLGLSASAAEPGERRLTLGGFGTLGLLYHDDEGLEYRRSEAQPAGAEAGKLDLATDSLAGLQLNAAWSRQLEFVAQAVTRRSADNDWSPEVTRGFVRYDPASWLRLEGGRIGWDIFPRADSRNIGYSLLTIRPAVEVFGFIPTDFFDGGQVALMQPVGTTLAGLKFYGGNANGKFVDKDGSTNDLNGSKLWGGHLDGTVGDWALRLGAGVFELGQYPDLDALIAGLRQTGDPQATALAEDFARKDRTVVFLTAGAAYDGARTEVRIFVGHTQTDGYAAPNLDGALVIAGYHLGRFTPYASWAVAHNRDDIRPTGLPDTPPFAALNAGAYAVQAASRYDQSGAALGVRYDVMPRVALKVQLDHAWIRGSAMEFDRRADPGSDTEMTLVGVALDFVF